MRTNKQIISLLRYGPRQEGFNDLKLILSEEERDSFYEYLEAQPEFKCDCPCLFASKREVIRFDCDTEADGGEESFVLWDKRPYLEPVPDMWARERELDDIGRRDGNRC